MDLRQRINELEYEYRLDQRELARILIVASTTLFIFSLHGVLTLSSTADSLDSLESEYSRISGMVGTEEFNNTISALEDVQGGEIGNRMQYAADVFRGLQDVGAKLESATGNVNDLVNMYRWLVLLSILGEVAGVSLIYM